MRSWSQFCLYLIFAPKILIGYGKIVKVRRRRFWCNLRTSRVRLGLKRGQRQNVCAGFFVALLSLLSPPLFFVAHRPPVGCQARMLSEQSGGRRAAAALSRGSGLLPRMNGAAAPAAYAAISVIADSPHRRGCIGMY